MNFQATLDAILANDSQIRIAATGNTVRIPAVGRLVQDQQEKCVLLLNAKFFPMTEIVLDEAGKPYLKEDHLGFYFDSRGVPLGNAVREFNRLHKGFRRSIDRLCDV